MLAHFVGVRHDDEFVVAQTFHVNAHYNKMDQPKYHQISEGMYGQLEAWGRQRIQTLFADPE